MTPRKSTPMKGTDAKAALHVQNTVVRETVAQDSIQQLIAFASTILVRPIESEGRLFNEDTEGNHRLTRILDSIANISISQSKGEVVAVAVQISEMDIRLIIGSNNSLPDSTITHLKEIWNILQH